MFYHRNITTLHPKVTTKSNIFFGADKNIQYYNKFTFKGMDMKKHVLFSVTIYPVVLTIKTVFGTSLKQAIISASALFAALNIVLAFFVLRMITRVDIAVLTTVIYGFLFSNTFIYSVNETYILSNLTIALYLYHLIKYSQFFSYKNVIALALLNSLAALYNPSLLLLFVPAFFMLYRHCPKTRMISYGCMHVGITSIFYIGVVYAIFGLKFFSFAGKYTTKYASFENFTNIKLIANTFGSFIFFAVISPFVSMQRNSSFLGDFSQYFSSVFRIFGLFSYMAVLYFIINHTITRKQRLTNSMLLFMLAMALFFTYWNPREAMLYSSQILLPFSVILARAFGGMDKKFQYPMMTVFLLLVAINNSMTVFNSF
jgi:hypothetical protein